MKKPILHSTQRCLARTAVNLLCGIELEKYTFYAYVFYSEDKNSLQCGLYVGPESILHGASFSPAMYAEPEKLDTIVRLARYTITFPTSDEKYLEWRDTKQALLVDSLLEKYEESYAEAVVTLYNSYYKPIL